jgi:MFS family permease
VAFLVNSTGYLISAIAVFSIRGAQTTPPGRQAQASVRGVWNDLREGVRFLFSNRTLIGCLVCMSVIMLGLGAINVVWVPYLQRTFSVGAAGLGLVDSAQGAGMVVSGLALGFLSARLSKWNMISGGIMVCGLALAAMGVAPVFLLIIGLGFIIGLGITPAQSAMNTLMQVAVPDEKRGRVGSSFNAITTFASLISMVFAAGLSGLLSLRTIYVVFGSLIILSGFLGFWLIREPEEPRALEELKVIPKEISPYCDKCLDGHREILQPNCRASWASG